MDQQGSVWLEEGSQTEEIEAGNPVIMKLQMENQATFFFLSTSIFHASGTFVCLKRNHLSFI